MLKSDAFYRRQELMSDVNLFPQQSEVKARHGNVLSGIMYGFFPDSIKKDCNLLPTMEGPGQDLWVSPSDLLISLVRLTPPLTSKCVQALTHQGILGIGSIVEMKFQNKMERDKERALKFLEEQLRYAAEKDKRKAIADERYNAKMDLDYTIERMHEECESSLKEALRELEERMLIEQDMKVREAQLAVEIAMERKMVEAVIDKARELSEEFERAFRVQAEAYDRDLQQAIREEKEACGVALKQAFDEKIECIKFLRHDVECRNMANIMYVLSIERERYHTELNITHDDYKIIIDDMTSRTLDLYNRIIDLENETECKTMELNAWKKRMIEIINQFQKFVNFTFRAVPTQAEFILNLTKMAQAEVNEEKKHRASNLIKFRGVDENVSPNQARLTTEERQVELDNFAVGSMDNLLNYKVTVPGPPTPLNSERTLNSDEDLPVFYYNKYLYIREDFRNKTMPDKLVLKIWSSQSDLGQATPYKSGVFPESEMKVNYPIASNVRFNAKMKPECGTCESSTTSLDMKKLQGGSSSNSGDFAELFKAEERDLMSKVAGSSMGSVACEEAKDNITKLKKIAIEKDSLIKHRASIRNSNVDGLDDVVVINQAQTNTRRPSRLLDVRNSLILARQSLTPKTPPVKKNSSDYSAARSKVPSRLLGTRNSLIIHRNSLRLSSRDTFQLKVPEDLHKKISSETNTPPKSHPAHVSLVAPESHTEIKISGSLKETKDVAKSSSHLINLPMHSQSTSMHMFYEVRQKSMQQIVGERLGWEHLQTPDEFGKYRFKHMMKMLKDNKSLLNLFTKVRT